MATSKSVPSRARRRFAQRSTQAPDGQPDSARRHCDGLRLPLAGLLVILGWLFPTSTANAGALDCVSYAYACTPGYSGNNAADTWAWKYYGGSWAATASGTHNCTLYVAYRLKQAGVPDPGRSWGNAANWGAALGYDHNPTVGSVAWWRGTDSNPYGHVAIVEAVSGGNIFIRADNWSAKPSGGYTSAGWVPASSVSGFIHLRDGSVSGGDANPVGAFDLATSPRLGSLRVAGWAIDRDVATSPTNIHVYVGGPAGSPDAAGADVGAASTSRPDVGAAYPGSGNNHGFDATIATRKYGWQWVYVYAINVAGTPGVNVELGRRRVYINDPSGTGSIGAWTRWNNGDHSALIGPPPSGAAFEGTFGLLLQVQKRGTVPLYSCNIGADEFTSRASNCEGQQVNGRLGYVYKNKPTGTPTRAIYRCTVTSNGDHFNSTDRNCEAQRTESKLGYTVLVG